MAKSAAQAEPHLQRIRQVLRRTREMDVTADVAHIGSRSSLA